MKHIIRHFSATLKRAKPCFVTAAGFLILIITLAAFTASFPNPSANALLNVNTAYKIGANGDGTVLTDVWDGTANSFNQTYMRELFSKMIGKSGATVADVKAYIEANGVDEFGSKIIKSPVIGANSGNATYGIVVKLNGFDWMVTSLTIDNNGNVVATLYLSDCIKGGIQFNSIGQDMDKPAPDNMYSTAPIRTNLISPTGAFGAFASGSFAANYLVRPDAIAYQHTQANSLKGLTGLNENFPNDALDSVPGYGYERFDYSSKENYNAWGNDTIWLPSLVETGYYTRGEFNGIWGLTWDQLKFSTEKYCWTRSGFRVGFAHGYVLNANSAQQNYVSVRDALGLRPAIHLNLSAAAGFSGDTAYNIGANGDGSVLSDIWNGTSNSFEKNYLTELLSKAIGKDNATVDDVKSYIGTNGTEEFGSRIVKSPAIRTNAGSPDYGSR